MKLQRNTEPGQGVTPPVFNVNANAVTKHPFSIAQIGFVGLVKAAMELLFLAAYFPESFAAARAIVANPGSPPGFVAQRNILLIIADDVGVDQIPAYVAYHEADNPITVTTKTTPVEMPTLSKLTNAGIMFVNAWSSPICSPTRASLYTGNHSFRHGVYRPEEEFAKLPTTINVDVDGDGVPEATPTETFAGVLGAAGYANALFGKWHLGTDLKKMSDGTENYGPIYFGWDYFSGSLAGRLSSYVGWAGIRADKDVYDTFVGEYATIRNVTDAIEWIDSQSGPWMATVAFNAAHDPYESPDPGCWYNDRTDATDDQSYYRSMLECLDKQMGDLLDAITDQLDNTTIIFIGDNGTPMTITDHFDADKSKETVYEGGVNVPLIIADGYVLNHGEQSPWLSGIGRVASPGRVETALVQTLDIFATVVEIGRGSRGLSSGLDSVSLVPYLKSDSASLQRSLIFAETRPGDFVEGQDGWSVAVRSGAYKLIVKNYLSDKGETLEIYNLTSDRWESDNLLDDASVSRGEFRIKIMLRTSVNDLESIELPPTVSFLP